jgi:hypothetical protein
MWSDEWMTHLLQTKRKNESGEVWAWPKLAGSAGARWRAGRLNSGGEPDLWTNQEGERQWVKKGKIRYNTKTRKPE